MQKHGFTLVELSLAIAFISILSIAVTLIITSSISSYHRGITLNKINTTGMDLVDDISSAIQASPANKISSMCLTLFSDDQKDKCENNKGQKFVSVTRNAKVTIANGETIENAPVYGAFCTGKYSYIWNSGYFFNKEEYSVDGGNLEKANFEYKAIDGASHTISNFKLLKVKDKNRKACISAVINSANDPNKRTYNDDPLTLSNKFAITDVSTEEPIDLLPIDKEGFYNNLALYSLYSAPPAEDSANTVALYSVSFILGTLQGGLNIMATGDYCDPPESYSSVENFDYCAINKFNFAAQATGGGE